MPPAFLLFHFYTFHLRVFCCSLLFARILYFYLQPSVSRVRGTKHGLYLFTKIYFFVCAQPFFNFFSLFLSTNIGAASPTIWNAKNVLSRVYKRTKHWKITFWKIENVKWTDLYKCFMLRLGYARDNTRFIVLCLSLSSVSVLSLIFWLLPLWLLLFNSMSWCYSTLCVRYASNNGSSLFSLSLLLLLLRSTFFFLLDGACIWYVFITRFIFGWVVFFDEADLSTNVKRSPFN